MTIHADGRCHAVKLPTRTMIDFAPVRRVLGNLAIDTHCLGGAHLPPRRHVYYGPVVCYQSVYGFHQPRVMAGYRSASKSAPRRIVGWGEIATQPTCNLDSKVRRKFAQKGIRILFVRCFLIQGKIRACTRSDTSFEDPPDPPATFLNKVVGLERPIDSLGPSVHSPRPVSSSG